MIFNEFGIALFLMAVGLSAAGVGTHLYQMVWNSPAEITYAGRNYFATLGHLVVSFVCGPYIMLGMGLARDKGEPLSWPTLTLAAFIAFGWAFITGILLMGLYLAITG